MSQPIASPDCKSPLPLLMKPDEILNLDRAAYRARKSTDTVRRLCKRYGIARQAAPNAPLEISSVGLEMVLHGDLVALDLLRAGHRQDEAVRRYFDHLGLSG